MGGYDEQVATMGEWMPPNSSPRSFFSPGIANDVAYCCNESMQEPPDPEMEGRDSSGDAVKNNLATQGNMGGYDASDSNALGGSKMGSRGCLRERRLARGGFNAPWLNTEDIKPTLSKNSEVRSPYLTIPPGLSPTCLLDSPVFLSNSLVVPSPTTGKFLFGLSVNNDIPTVVTDDPNNGKENTFNDASSFAFKPIAESRSVPSFGAACSVHAPGFGSQSFPSFAVSYSSDTSLLHSGVEAPNFRGFPKLKTENVGNNLSPVQTTDSAGATESSPLDELCEDDGDQRSGEAPNNVGDEADDGYNWRKYGQKQVKGSEYPRSYFKCTYSNCVMKKKVERSHEGHVTEIIYKGNHNHPKPSRKSALGSSNALGGTHLGSECDTGTNGGLIWSSMQTGINSGAAGWGQENPEVKSSAATMVQENENGAIFSAQNSLHHESGDGVDQSSTLSNEEGNDDRITRGSISLGYDGEGDESESKRRRIDTYPSEITGATRAIREPRVVVQTTSDVDILDDGYRWRKYGQKVVKGNPNPRSYYKCTSPGCIVRKHVERASHDLKSVITTYEGKHNHEVPAARNSGGQHSNPGNSNPVPSQHHSTAASVSMQVPSHLQRPTNLLQIQNLQSCLSQFGKSPMDPFNFAGKPRLDHYGPGFRFGTNHPGLAGVGMDMGALGIIQQGKLAGLPMLQRSNNTYMGNQGQFMNGMGYVVPKTEPKLEAVTDSTVAANGGSAVYQQLMSQMPLGEQM